MFFFNNGVRKLLVSCALLTAGFSASAGTPHLDSVEETLREVAPDLEGTVWGRTEGNTISGSVGSWLLQTPGCWGSEDCARPEGFDNFQSTVRADIASAEHGVDITTLVSYPDGILQEDLVSGLQTALARNPGLKIRILGGAAPCFGNLFGVRCETAAHYMSRLKRDLGKAAENARIMVAGMQTQFMASWNHAKILVVDGRTAVVGGHNFWSDVYGPVTDPVSDVSMRLTGPGAAFSQRYNDQLWAFVCKTHHRSLQIELRRSKALKGQCLDNEAPKKGERTGSVAALAVGALGLGMQRPRGNEKPLSAVIDRDATCSPTAKDRFNNDPAYAALNPDIASLRALIASAKKSIFLSQQDLISPCFPPFANWRYDARLLDILVAKLLEGVRLRIVVSTPGAKQGDANGTYSFIKDLTAVTGLLLQKLEQAGLSVSDAKATLCGGLQLAPLRVAHGVGTWSNGHAIANHGKVVLVDDVAFYVGSRNLYPTILQEFGFIVEDETAAAELREQYSVPMWENSKSSAIIDAETGVCGI